MKLSKIIPVFLLAVMFSFYSVLGTAFALNSYFSFPGLNHVNSFYGPWTASPYDGIIVGNRLDQTTFVLNSDDLSIKKQFLIGPSLYWDGYNLFSTPLVDYDASGNPIIVQGRLYDGRNQDIGITCSGAACGSANIAGAFNLDGGFLWSAFPGGTELLFPASVTSYDQNGEKYYIVAANHNVGDLLRIAKVSSSGEILWLTGAGLSDSFTSDDTHDSTAPIVGDVTGDGELEIIVTGLKHSYILDGDGNVLFTSNSWNWGQPIFDGKRVYFKNFNGIVYVYEYIDGQFQQVLTTGLFAVSSDSDNFAVCDIDKDGVGEIVLTGGGGILKVYNGNGSVMFNTVYADKNGPDLPSTTPPICADVDGDNELEVVAASRGGWVRAFNSDGTKALEFHVTYDSNGNVYKDSDIGNDLWIKGLISSPLPDENGPLHLIVSGASKAGNPTGPAGPGVLLTHELPYTDVRLACLTLGCNNYRNGQLVQFGEYVEDPAVIEFEVASAGGKESVSEVNVNLNMAGEVADPVTVYLSVDESSTADPLGYVLGAETVTFESGETLKSIPLTILDDDKVEEDQTLVLNLKVTEGNAVLGENAQFTYTILNDDVAPEDPAIVSFETISASGEESAIDVIFKVNLQGSVSDPVSVLLNLNSSSTVEAEDYKLTNNSLTFASGETEKIVSLKIINDNAYEKDETIILNLEIIEGNAVLGDETQYTYTILNDDQVSNNEKLQYYWACWKDNCSDLLKAKNYTPYRTCSLGCWNDSQNYVPEEEWCKDSDGGINYSTYGTVTSNNNPTGITDSCYTFGNGKTYLFEGVCKNGKYVRYQKNCKEMGADYACVNGACVKQ